MQHMAEGLGAVCEPVSRSVIAARLAGEMAAHSQSPKATAISWSSCTAAKAASLERGRLGPRGPGGAADNAVSSWHVYLLSRGRDSPKAAAPKE